MADIDMPECEKKLQDMGYRPICISLKRKFEAEATALK